VDGPETCRATGRPFDFVAAHRECESSRVRIRNLNWMQLEEYLQRDNRIVLPVGSTEQHAYLSLETDNIIAEPLPAGIPALPDRERPRR